MKFAKFFRFRRHFRVDSELPLKQQSDCVQRVHAGAGVPVFRVTDCLIAPVKKKTPALWCYRYIPCELVCLALQAGRTCSSFLFSDVSMTTSYFISTPQLLLLGPFPGKGWAKGPFPVFGAGRGGLEAVQSCQQCSSST
ncbi:uncharacterized protein M8220_007407 [Acridotheres tristis]